jgi:hypothetical protein
MEDVMTQSRLACNIENGMFSNENVAIITTSDGEYKSFFVPHEIVSDGALLVKILETRDDMVLISFRSEGYETLISVKSDKLLGNASV